MYDTGSTTFMLICTMLVFLMTPGLAFFYGGLSRRKNVINTMLMCFGVIGLVGVLWIVAGWSLAYGMNSQNKNPYAHYHCSKYGQGLHQCSMHYIRYDVLYAYVLSRLQYWSVLAQQDGDKLLKRLLNASDKERNTARKRQTAELKKAEKRKAEVDTLFAKMYEDWSAGRITEYNFNMLSEKYQGEQRELDAKIERLHEAMEAAAQTAVDAEKWIGLMKQYVNPTELTAELLNTLIEKILVHEAVKSEDGSREQEVEIFYRFIGKIE